MDILTRVRERFGSAESRGIVAEEATPEITAAVTKALQQAISQSNGGPVVVINNLTVNVQINAVQGGGATINVRS